MSTAITVLLFMLRIFSIRLDGSRNSYYQPLESGWVVYGPEDGYNFPYPRLLRVQLHGNVAERHMYRTSQFTFCCFMGKAHFPFRPIFLKGL